MRGWLSVPLLVGAAGGAWLLAGTATGTGGAAVLSACLTPSKPPDATTGAVGAGGAGGANEGWEGAAVCGTDAVVVGLPPGRCLRARPREGGAPFTPPPPKGVGLARLPKLGGGAAAGLVGGGAG